MTQIEGTLRTQKDFIVSGTYKIGLSVKEFYEEYIEYKAPFATTNYWEECGEQNIKEAEWSATSPEPTFDD